MSLFVVPAKPSFLWLGVFGAAFVCLAMPALSQPAAPSSEPATPAASPAACDAACIRANSEPAAKVCARRVEAEAPTDYEWVTRPFINIFQQAEPPGANESAVRYRGDSIRFLSPQKEWVRITYECGFDPRQQKVEFVNVRLGRLDRPDGVAANRQVAPPQTAPQVQAARGPTQPSAQPRSNVAKPPVGEPSEIEILQVNPHRIRR
ncbi:hypothetical protein ABEG18_06020 [Alsobacter sp. KACC 23698]|uniref:Uncharacterized protein n=1 Tax=Alsobacter sp. KACC 23698 TaxID=3149229 RepID=A0AAU7JK33_9HYPH